MLGQHRTISSVPSDDTIIVEVQALERNGASQGQVNFQFQEAD